MGGNHAESDEEFVALAIRFLMTSDMSSPGKID